MSSSTESSTPAGPPTAAGPFAEDTTDSGHVPHHTAHDSVEPLPATQAHAVQGLGRPTAVPGYPGAGAPVSMAMHLHASFSEKTASFEAHLAEARRLGVDVLWWTDHDFRVNAHGFWESVGFDGPTEPGPAGFQWEWVTEDEGQLSTAFTEFVDDPRSPDEPGRALRLTAVADQPATRWLHGKAGNRRYSTSLADTTIELDVRPVMLSDPSALLVEIESSFHPARAGRPAGRYTITYRITAADQPAARRHRVSADGLTGIVDVAVPAERWERLQLRPVDDFAALWPDLIAADNALAHLKIGATSAGRQPADVVVDRLRFIRAERDGRAALDLRRRVLDAYVDAFPDIRQYEAVEVSLTRHLNWFGGDLALPDYGGLLHRDNNPELARRAAAMIHSHRGLASWNHPLGAMYGPETKEELAAILLRTNALDCDVIEVGNNPDLDEMLWVFDVACRNGVFVTASGVSDDHTAEDWVDQQHNYLTNIWSPTVELPDVTAALQAGRAWFSRAEWRGCLDIELAGTSAMGSALLTTDATAPARIHACDLPADSTLEVVTGSVDPAGPGRGTPDTVSVAIPAAQLPASGHGLDLPTGSDGGYARAQLRDSDGQILAVSNPVWALPPDTRVAIPPVRLMSAP